MLRPLPYEKPSQTNSTLQRSTKQKPRKSKKQSKPRKPQTSTEKLLDQASKKITSFLQSTGKKTLPKINEIEAILHRSVLALHKEKRNITNRNSKKRNDKK